MTSSLTEQPRYRSALNRAFTFKVWGGICAAKQGVHKITRFFYFRNYTNLSRVRRAHLSDFTVALNLLQKFCPPFHSPTWEEQIPRMIPQLLCGIFFHVDKTITSIIRTHCRIAAHADSIGGAHG